MSARTAALQRRNDRLATSALLIAVTLALLVAGSARTAGTFTGTTDNPANTLATSTSFWFDANGTASAICTGLNSSLACPYLDQARPGTVFATFTLQNKNTASDTFTLEVIDGTGPAGISTLVSPKFAGTGTASEALASGASDTVKLKLKLTNATAVGTYTGWVRASDSTSGRSFDVPISVTVQ